MIIRWIVCQFASESMRHFRDSYAKNKDLMVVDAVCSELVSGRISLIYGKIQGKIANLPVIEQFERLQITEIAAYF